MSLRLPREALPNGGGIRPPAIARARFGGPGLTTDSQGYQGAREVPGRAAGSVISTRPRSDGRKSMPSAQEATYSLHFFTVDRERPHPHDGWSPGAPREAAGDGGPAMARGGANWPIELDYSTEKQVKGRFRWNVSGMRGNSKKSTIWRGIDRSSLFRSSITGP